MSLKIYNTLSGKKEDFRMLEPNRVSMYVCGVTVYDLSHIGHARGAIFFDVMRRFMENQGWEVKYVRNFTDIDDKIINRAQQENISTVELAERYIKEYQLDMAALGVKVATLEPKATEYMSEIIQLIASLEKKGLAYQVGGDVYYSVINFQPYGKLSNRATEEMVAGARVEVNPLKKHPLDFALWKSSKSGEPSWDSPWGAGRPGWHIECSAMSMKLLGETFDIHGGGKDLIFPHHENEIAQSEGLTGKPLANYWVHNGFVSVNSEKMSKSLGNFFTIKEVLAKYPAEVIRFFLLATHYRSPVDFSDNTLEEETKSLARIYNALERAQEIIKDQTIAVSLGHAFLKNIKKLQTAFQEAMEDDFNTALAIAAVFDLVRELNTFIDGGVQTAQDRWALKVALDEIQKIGQILGLFTGYQRKDLQALKPALILLKQQLLGISANDCSPEEILEEILAKRLAARAQKNWEMSDKIRQGLTNLGIEIKDTSTGTTWKLSASPKRPSA